MIAKNKERVIAMLIDAVIENGQVKLLQTIQFVRTSFAVKVDIPDEEIMPRYQAITGQNQINQQDGIIAEFIDLSNALFGDGYRYIPEKSEREILSEVLCEKYGPWSSFIPPNVECGDSSPLSEPCGYESLHSINSPIGLNGDQGQNNAR